MTEYTSSKSVLTTVFINLFSLTQCPSYIDRYIDRYRYTDMYIYMYYIYYI